MKLSKILQQTEIYWMLTELNISVIIACALFIRCFLNSAAIFVTNNAHNFNF